MTTIRDFLAQLESEAPRTRRALERVPEGRDDWTPHEKSMPLGRLAMLVATMWGWIPMVVNQDELNLGGNFHQEPLRTVAALVGAHDKAVRDARAALEGTTEQHLDAKWRLLAGGKEVSAEVRRIVLRDTFMHLAHHRGQLTVYLRLNGAPVPSIYGPSADDQRFA